MTKELVDAFFDREHGERPGGAGATVSVAAARRIAELHGGRLEAEQLAPFGLRIKFHLPTDS